MTRKLIGRDMSDSAFSTDRLKLWTMGVNLTLTTVGIIYLIDQGKEAVPLGTIAGALITRLMIGGAEDKPKSPKPCPVCGTTAINHTGEQCAMGLAARQKKSKLKENL